METQSVNRYGNCGILTCQIIERLKDGTPGDTITDEDMLAVTGGKATDPDGPAYQNVLNAIDYVRTHFGRTWKRVPKTNAIKCLEPSEIVAVGRTGLRLVRRTARRATRSLASIDVNALESGERTEAAALAAQLGTLVVFADAGTTKKLETRSVNSVPDPSRVLELWK